ncbi:hypothetical protein H0176_22220 [Methylorubrum populi]|uniref:hypothetical protein n=1 Tax=Methylorubrum rhodesianum TaxID=29427 RepID=UPI00190D4FC2|nr:hypothetical protein [Methylorubrum rhodesianum]MBK3404176.1 hypothetical protein [Methylorubrum rhodesianum]MBY0142966.1 hypothetical protein [Methylorubrum populi]
MGGIPATPGGLLHWASREIPAQTKLVLAGVIIFAGAALALGWTKQFSPGLTFAAALSILVFGLVASALSAAPKAISGAGGLLAWALSTLFIALLALMLSSTFFGWPPAGARLMARLLGSAEVLASLRSEAKPVVVERGRTETLSVLPDDLRSEPVSSDPAARVQELAALPVLTVAGTLRMSGPDERRYLSASELRLDGGSLVTNGGDLVVEVNNLVSDNGTLIATPTPDGAAGRGGGRVLIIVHGRITGRLGVDLRGARGADGTPGSAGAGGGKGPTGDNAASGLADCSRGAGRGGKGGPGLAGGDGAAGRPGGNGGVLIVRAADLAAAKRVIADAVVTAGPGGRGGPGGQGGPGGPGGDGGSPRGWCSGGGPGGPQGDQGPTGRPGADGAAGADGSVKFEQLPGV